METAGTSEPLAALTTLPGREDPYPAYDRLRAIWPLIRAEDGALVVSDSRLGHMPTEMLGFIGLADWAGHPALRTLFTSMLTLNPPDHTRNASPTPGRLDLRRTANAQPATA